MSPGNGQSLGQNLSSASQPFTSIRPELAAVGRLVPPALLGPLSLCSAGFGRLSRRKSAISEDKVEQLVAGENGPVMRRVTRAAAAAAAAAIMASASPIPESPTPLTRKPTIVPRVEIGVSERHRAEQHVSQHISTRAPSPAPSDEESTPKKSEARRLESVAVSSLMATPQDPKGRGVNAGRSVSKLRIARTSPVPQDAPGSPASPWQERVLAPILPDNLSTPKGALVDRRSVRRSLIAPSSPGPQNSLAQKYSLVDKSRSTVRRSNRLAQNATKEPAASARIICESGLSSGWGAVGSWAPSLALGDPSNHPVRSCLSRELWGCHVSYLPATNRGVIVELDLTVVTF